MPVFGEPLQLTNRGLRLTLFVKEITAQDMENAKNSLAHSLNAFFRCLSDDGFADFVTRVRPIHGSSLRPLYLGAFQTYSRLPGSHQPCVLLLRLATPLDDSSDHATTTTTTTTTATLVFVRLMCFSTMLPRTEIQTNPEWSLKTCYVKTTNDTELSRRGLSLGHQARPSISYNFWTWRTPSKHLRQLALNVSTTEDETRPCLHVGPDGEHFRACLISVAARKGRYWIGTETGAGIEVDEAAERFRGMDLEEVWVSAREVGVIGVDSCEVGPSGKRLWVTLVVERLGVF